MAVALHPTEVEAVYTGDHVAVFVNGRWELLVARGRQELSGQRIMPAVRQPQNGGDPTAVFNRLLACGRTLAGPALIKHLNGADDITVSGHQPSYHAYVPLFGRVVHADVFTFADDMAFGRQKFQHRQRIPDGAERRWITLPVASSPTRTAIGDKRIRDVIGWQQVHWEAVQRAYDALPFFALIGRFYEQIYATTWRSLAALNEALWLPLGRLLAPSTACFGASQLNFDRSGRKGERIAAELQAIGGVGRYLCGAASQYLNAPSDTDPLISFAEVIRRVGFSVERCTLNMARFAAATPTSPHATVLELVAREGAAAGDMVRACTDFERVEG